MPVLASLINTFLSRVIIYSKLTLWAILENPTVQVKTALATKIWATLFSNIFAKKIGYWIEKEAVDNFFKSFLNKIQGSSCKGKNCAYSSV